MAIVATDDRYYAEIADTIRDKFETTSEYRPEEMAMGIQMACDYQYAKGVEAGGAGGDDRYDEGFEDGKQVQYDAFWDTYQTGGNRTAYAFAFAGVGWTNDTCKPKYDMQVSNAERMFAASKIVGDLDEILGVALDFSQCTNMAYAFYQTSHTASEKTTLGTVDLSSAKDVTSVFNSVGIERIKKLVPPSIEMKNTCWQNELIDLTVTGAFVANVNLSRCAKLTAESIESVIVALSDTATGKTATFSKTAVEAAFTTDEWNTLVATKTNWTIAKA